MIFDSKKTAEEKILYRLIENLPEDNDKYFIEHDKSSTNSFWIRQDKNQGEKENHFELICNADRKLARSLPTTDKATIVDLKRIRNSAIAKLKDLGKDYEHDWV